MVGLGVAPLEPRSRGPALTGHPGAVKFAACGFVVLALTTLVACSGDDDDAKPASTSTTRVTTSSSSSSSSSSPSSSSSTTGPGSTSGSQVVAGGFTASAATLELRGSVDAVTVSAGDLGREKYRVSVPSASGASPSANVHNNRVVVSINRHDNGELVAVEVRLSRDIPWSLVLASGKDETVDFRRGHLAALDVTATASSIEVTLPAPTASIPIRTHAGAGEVTLHAPPEVPVRVAFGGGAGSAVIDGTAMPNVAAATSITPPSWEAATKRYDVTADAALSAFTLDRSR
jgi:hypothetical protein